MNKLSFEFLLFWTLTISLIINIFSPDIESKQNIAEILKILLIGYLGYITPK